jgi:hypothetical protein
MLKLEDGEYGLHLQTAEGKALWQGRLLVRDDDGEYPAVISGDAVRAGPWELKVAVATSGAADVLRLEVAPAGERRLQAVLLEVAGGQGAVPDLTSPHTKALVFSPKAFDLDGVVTLGPDANLRSRLAIVLGKTPRTPALLWGLGGPAEDLALFTLHDGRLRAGFEVNRVLTVPTAFPLIVGSAPDGLELLDTYGKALATFARPRSPAPTGWNTWDYYAGAITMNDVRREMAALRDAGMTHQLRYVVIDMGWEQAWGEWVPNRRFPASFREIAAEITAAGFSPGIWLSPLQCHRFSPLGRHRQDLLVRGADGFPAMVGEHGMLDFSQDDALHIIRHWCGEMREAGFRFFKVDYLYPEYLEAMGGYADRRFGKAGVIRRGLEAIRQAVGEDSHILNCCGPIEAALGIADSSRATIDIHTFWGHIKCNAAQLACRLWQHGRLWNVDPDFAVVRCRQTSQDPYLNMLYPRRPLTAGQNHWLAGDEAALPELQAWLSLVFLSAGSTFLSDSITRLAPAGLGMLAKLFPALPEAARPLDLFLNPIPRFWLGSDGRRQVLGVFNWSDQTADSAPPRSIEVPTKGVDIWTGKQIEIGPETRMKPHTAWLLRV